MSRAEPQIIFIKKDFSSHFGNVHVQAPPSHSSQLNRKGQEKAMLKLDQADLMRRSQTHTHRFVQLLKVSFFVFHSTFYDFICFWAGQREKEGEKWVFFICLHRWARALFLCLWRSSAFTGVRRALVKHYSKQGLRGGTPIDGGHPPKPWPFGNPDLVT